MGRTFWRQHAEFLLAESDHGVIGTARLLELGIGRTVTYERCRPGGPWQLLLPGTILLQSGAPTWRQRLAGALSYGGSNAQLSGAAAAQLHGLRRSDPGGRVQLLIPETTRRKSAGYVVVERTNRLPDPAVVGGMRVAPVGRALLDHARRLRDRGSVQAVISEAVQRGFVKAIDLLDELDAGSPRGTALVRAELLEVLGGARSPAEIAAKRLARRTKLPEPLWNVQLFTESGEFVGNPDAWWDDVGLAWEIDSHGYHLGPTDHARTLRRNGRYAKFGVPHLPTLPAWLKTQPATVIGDLEAAHARAALSPRPRLIVQACERPASTD